jgi:hypothetical protein
MRPSQAEEASEGCRGPQQCDDVVDADFEEISDEDDKKKSAKSG